MVKVLLFIVFRIHKVAAKGIDDKGQESYNNDTEDDVNKYFS